MNQPVIPGGYVLLSRRVIESEIWEKPPLYMKVWIYLLSQAQHQDYKQLKRGQLRTSIPEIQEACSWYVGYRKETPSKDQIYRIIDWLRKSHEQVHEDDTTTTMITTTRATQGMLVNIVNYDLYQTSKNYERNNERNDEKDTTATMPQQRSNNINKNDKNDKNDKKIYKDIVEYLNKKTNKNYKHTSNKTKSVIDARVNEGFNLDDFKKVIDIKSSQWLHDSKMNKFLRPETLFSNKFEGYLNEKVGGEHDGANKQNNTGLGEYEGLGIDLSNV